MGLGPVPIDPIWLLSAKTSRSLTSKWSSRTRPSATAPEVPIH